MVNNLIQTIEQGAISAQWLELNFKEGRKMSIKTRLPKINKIALIAKKIYNSGNGKVVYRVDSFRTGKPFQVSTEVYRNGILNAQVSLYTFDHKEQVNQIGNHPADFNHWTVCYQGLGALKKRAKDAGKILSICKSKEAAERLLNFGGELIKISNLSNGIVWGTLR